MAHYTKEEVAQLAEISKVEEGPKYKKLIDRFCKRTKRNRNAVSAKIQRIRLKEQFSEIEHYDVPMDENEERMLNYEIEKAEIKQLVNDITSPKSLEEGMFNGDIKVKGNITRITVFNGGLTFHFD